MSAVSIFTLGGNEPVWQVGGDLKEHSCPPNGTLNKRTALSANPPPPLLADTKLCIRLLFFINR
jgi:hypothetical protein